MATIVNTLIEGLTSQMVQARLNTADAKQFLFAKYFPVKRVNGFVWKTLQSQIANTNVAADLHTDNGTIARKRRPTFESAQGDIPFISISRELSRSEIKDYQTALAFAKDADAAKLVQYWGDDVDFCFNGVQSEIEFIAWKLLSNACRLDFSTTNNATYANEFALDYDVYDWQKKATLSDWNNAKTADIIGDLVKIVKEAREKGLNPKFAFVNLNEFYRICSAEQIIKACSSYLVNTVGIAQTPDLAQVNAMLARQPWLNGLQIRVIDQTITREFADGTQVTGNPFEDNRIVLTETELLGATQYDILQENNPTIIRVERAHTVIKKYGTAEPQAEITIGQADALPVVNTCFRNIYVKTDGKAWE